METRDASILTQVAFKAAVETTPPSVLFGDDGSIGLEAEAFRATFEFYVAELFSAVKGSTDAVAPPRQLTATNNDYTTDRVKEVFNAEEVEPSNGFRLEAANDQQGPWPTKVLQECAADGVTKVWDNRNTATGRQPQFKEFVVKGQRGHGKDGTPKGYWVD